MSFLTEKNIGILYNFPSEYNPVALELLRRNLPVEVVNGQNLILDPGKNENDYSLIFSDLSTPSGHHPSRHTPEIISTFVKHFETNHVKFAQGRIINPSGFIEILASRSRQLSIFSSLGIPFPKSRIIHTVEKLISILPQLKFPILLKRNNPFENGLVQKFESLTELLSAVIHAEVPLHEEVLLVQEYSTPKNNHVVRLDILNGKFLSARRVYTLKDSKSGSIAELEQESFVPYLNIINAAEEIARAARIDLGTVEYFTDRKSNQVQFYGIQPFLFSSYQESSSGQLERIGEFFERRLQKIREFELAL